MTRQHKFGGIWTEQKLAKLKGYLEAYGRVFSGEKTSHFTTYYVDAFAGTGSRSEKNLSKASDALFPEFNDSDSAEFRKGSARIALEVNPGFKKFLFIEQNGNRVSELEALKLDYQSKADQISIVRGEANAALKQWCASVDWKTTRAVVFLDPYGVQVEWALLETLANTKGIDLWLLFPLGTGVMRVLTKKKQPPLEWAECLTRIFGSDEWKSRFYKIANEEDDLFGESSAPQRSADYKQIADYLIERMGTIFAGVQKTPYALYNSKNCPLYLLIFAAGNKRSAPIALRIANHLLKD